MWHFFKTVPGKVYIIGLLISLAPIGVMCVARITTPPTHSFNWEIQYDQFVYATQSREIFENGNSFAYSNPSDCLDDSPVIYSYLFPLLVGYLWKVTNLPIMFVYIPIRIIFGMLLTVIMWHFASLFFKDKRVLTISFYCLMIGGGVSSWLGVIGCLRRWKISSVQFFNYVGYFEGTAGWWFLNVFRNFFYATETVYHVLFFLTLFLVLKRFWKSSLLFFALTLYAHPYTGLQLGLIYLCYFFLSFFLEHDGRKKYLLYGACSSFLFALFLSYNLFWLRGFPQHKQLMNELMGVDYGMLALRELIICYGIWLWLGFYAVIRYFKDIISSRNWRLILILLGVSFMLANHQHFTPYSAQPAHFTHGYVFIPLVLFTFYLYETKIQYINGFTTFLQKPLFIVLFIIITALDNLCFLPRAYEMAQLEPMTITRTEKNVLQFLSTLDRRFVIASTNMSIGYLITLFTEHDAVFGNIHITPKRNVKRSLMQDLIEKGDLSLLREYKNINVIILTKAEKELVSHYNFFKQWRSVFKNEEFSVYLITG